MNIWKKITGAFSSGSQSDANTYWIYARCNRCGEVLRGRVDLRSELSIQFKQNKTTYFCRKVLIGEQRCFQRIEVQLTFNQQKKLLDREIQGGVFIDRAEYERLSTNQGSESI